jgi:superfamily II DNA or RNA helicase
MARRVEGQHHIAAPLWAGLDSRLAEHAALQSRRCLEAYKANPLLVKEHANIERATAQGGYGRRQIYELIQNGADAMIGAAGGKIEVLLTESALYCANEGDPIDVDGLNAILSSHVSMKRGTEIGRFGLGFKSVLGTTDSPEFYSRSGSFRFSAADSAVKIRDVVPDAEVVPTLRLTTPIDPASEALEDDTLTALLDWATTVVKLPRKESESSWLSEDIQRFPSEFLLFSPHVSLLVLEDRTTNLRREIRLKRHHDHLRLIEGSSSNAWRCFSTHHSPSPSAHKDAGELAGRNNLPVIWAVPHGRPLPGRFWAFFPTEYVTTLSGIVNAPWKTSEDRQNLLTGQFNIELLRVVAELAADNLANLVNPNDPGWILDIMPARRDEFRNWADQELNDRFYELAAARPSVPDQDGHLADPSTLRLHPAGLPPEALKIWSEYPNRPKQWCHAAVDTRARRIRAERLLTAAGGQLASIEQWLEALVEDRTPAASSAAIRAAAIIAEVDPTSKWAVERSRIVLTEGGLLVRPTPGKVFLPSSYVSVGTDLAYVHRDVASSSEALSALAALGIQKVDAQKELEAHIATGFDSWKLEAWDKLWLLAELAGPQVAVQVLKSIAHPELIRARTLAGTYSRLQSILLPGDTIPEGDTLNLRVTIDTKFHAGTLNVLIALGAVSKPIPGAGKKTEEWFFGYRQSAISEYMMHVPPRSSRPREDYLAFDQETFIGPLEPIFRLSDEARARFTDEVLKHVDVPWLLRHESRQFAYPWVPFIAPSLWVIRQAGCLHTSRGYCHVPGCVAPALAEWADFLPVALCTPETALRLELPDTLEKLSDRIWNNAIESASGPKDIERLGDFYALAARFVSAPPDTIRCLVGDEWKSISPSKVTVVARRRECDVLMQHRVPVILVSELTGAEALVSRWQLKAPDGIVKTELYHIPLGSPTLVVDLFPSIRYRLRPERRDIVAIQCSALGVATLTELGKISEERKFHFEGQTAYWLEEIGFEGLLERLASALDLGLTSENQKAIVEHRTDLQRRERVWSIRSESSLAKRFLKAVEASRIRRRLPGGLLEAVEQKGGTIDDVRLAELAFVVYGVDLLHAFRSELDEAGLDPPAQWAGSRAAINFVKDLGFPREYAGFEQGRRDPILDVEGPPLLPPLHDFQRLIADNITTLVARGAGAHGLLSLPTGAGKTRVAVQALIESMKQGSPRLLLWVAQTDELCEQAVQTWSYVWRALGPQCHLCVNRLWATNEAEPFSGSQVVIATISKLQGCIGDPSYDWLSQSDCIIIDEAHGSTTPAFTALLEWQGISRGKGRCPLIGLTATPFRGRSEEETLRLVRRYGDYRLDAGVLGQDPYAKLQEMGVISRVRHVLLDGADIQLSQDELSQLQQTSRLPSSAEDRLGLDTTRNSVLIDSIKKLPVDWTALVFATSVDHAQTMAALLSLEGITAAPISAATEPAVRRYYIDEFRAGRIRVLTNYDVLAQGFDAPAVQP